MGVLVDQGWKEPLQPNPEAHLPSGATGRVTRFLPARRYPFSSPVKPIVEESHGKLTHYDCPVRQYADRNVGLGAGLLT